VQSSESKAKAADELQWPEYAEQHARERVEEECERNGGQP
jgi:hypothetical protein